MEEKWEVSEIGLFLARIDRIVSSDLPDLEPLEYYKLSEDQAKAILDLRLHRLTGMERNKLMEEAEKLAVAIEDYIDILQTAFAAQNSDA